MPGDFKHDLAPEAGRPGRRSWRRAATALAVMVASHLACGAGGAPTSPEFRQLEALPAVRQAAAVAGLAWTGLEGSAVREKMTPGDGVTVLVSLTKGKVLQQWLIDLTMAEGRAGDPLRTPNSARMFTSTGHQFGFDGGSAIIAITMVGPLKAGDVNRPAATAPEITRQRVRVSADYLALGLERVPALMLRLRARRQAEPSLPRGDLGISDRPYDSAVVEKDAKAAALMGITEADERSVIGSVLALQEFLQLTSRTPGLKDVLMSVLDVPWWSIIRSGGQLNFNLEGLALERELDPAVWALPGSEKVYASPFLLHINGRQALRFQLALVAPRPPLTVCAGIIGLAAVAPDGKGPLLTFQVVASRAAR